MADLLDLVSDVPAMLKAGWIVWLIWAAAQVRWYRMSREPEPVSDVEAPKPSWRPAPQRADAPLVTVAADVSSAHEVAVEPSLAAVLSPVGTRASKRRRRMSATTSPSAA